MIIARGSAAFESAWYFGRRRHRLVHGLAYPWHRLVHDIA